MSNDGAADTAWSVVSQLLSRLFHDHPPREVTAPEKVGSDTELFHAAQPRFYPFLREVAPTASFLVWRSGSTLALVMAVGQSFAEDDQAAVELARSQQVHIRKPTRYTRAERFDGEVALDDPALETTRISMAVMRGTTVGVRTSRRRPSPPASTSVIW